MDFGRVTYKKFSDPREKIKLYIFSKNKNIYIFTHPKSGIGLLPVIL